LNQKDKALAYYQQALEISQKIVQQDPTNSAAQRDLLTSYGKLGLLYKQLKQTKTALDFFNKALPIAERLAENKLNYQAQQDLKRVRADIDSVSKQ
jgi:tetratricopeptide (TPR) repeat protein